MRLRIAFRELRTHALVPLAKRVATALCRPAGRERASTQRGGYSNVRHRGSKATGDLDL